jgi:hypothetical protein
MHILKILYSYECESSENYEISAKMYRANWIFLRDLKYVALDGFSKLMHKRALFMISYTDF